MMRWPRSIGVLFALSGATIVLTDNCWGQNPTEYSKDNLLEIVRLSRDQIETIEVDYSFDAVQSPPTNPHTRYSGRAVVQGDHSYFDFIYGPDPTYRNVLFRRQVAFDGQRTTIAEVHVGLASIRDGRSSECRTNGKGFFDIQLLNPSIGGHGYDDVSLIGLLESPHSTLRRVTQSVQDTECHVIDLRHPDSGDLLMTVWVDPARAGLPLHTEIRLKGRSDRIKVEYWIDRAVEVFDGLWIATDGRKLVHSLGTGQPFDHDSEFEMHVLRDSEGAAVLAVNRRAFDDRIFSLCDHVIPGTEVRDLDSHEVWIASSGSVTGIVESYIAMSDFMAEKWPSEPHNTASSPSPMLKEVFATGSDPGIKLPSLDAGSSGPMTAPAATRSPACGPAALAVIYQELLAAQPDRLASAMTGLDDIADAYGNSSLLQLAHHAKSNGLHVYYGQLTPGHLTALSAPAILYCQLESTATESASHFVVNVGSTSERSVMLFDPIGGTGLRGEVSLGSLARIWTGDALVISVDPLPQEELRSAEDGDPNTISGTHSSRNTWRMILAISGLSILVVSIGAVMRPSRMLHALFP